MVNVRRDQHLFYFLVCIFLLLVPQTQGLDVTQGFDVPITYVHSAVAKGGVCLDGSPPVYHMDKGFGAGIDNWLILLEGGGWCHNASNCVQRIYTTHGSSNHMEETLSFSGILHNKPQFNPDFYNWNRIQVRYCDGSSFTGDVEDVNPSTKLHFRGQRVFRAVMDDLLAKGMSKAKMAMLTGCSAGGLATILNCDRFRGLLPGTAKVKCVADAGYFINAKAVNGAPHIERVYSDVVATHNSAKNLPQSCTSRLKPGLCFFPENVVSGIKTDLFIVNAAYDSWQINNSLTPAEADPHGTWHNCKLDISNCSADQLKVIQGFRTKFLGALYRVGGTPSSRGYFIDSCYAHSQIMVQETWLRSDSPTLATKSISKAVGDWFFDRSPFQKIDCPYPCNKSCKNGFLMDTT